VRARIRTTGRGGFLAARLWDVSAAGQTLVSRGVYRLEDDQKGEITFQLFGNGWRFAPGHTAKLELLGRDASFLRTSNFPFSVRVSKLQLDIPSR
jgi:predicted acyl esterase